MSQKENTFSYDFAGGRLVRYTAYPSDYVPPRNVDVWLPPGYDADPTKRWPVVYMQDGQNLFDENLSFSGVDWGADEAVAALMQEGKIQGAIVVGVWNTAYREEEYVPQGPVEDLMRGPMGEELRDFLADMGWELTGDDYLRFLVEELKPVIDVRYRTRPDPANTVVMGSSSGALISLYALICYPHIFGRAGCLSTHFPALDGALIEPLARSLPPPYPGRRLYFDFGTKSIDAEYEPFQRRFDDLLRQRGYTEGVDWMTRKFSGARHNERAWRKRLKIPMEFLLS